MPDIVFLNENIELSSPVTLQIVAVTGYLPGVTPKMIAVTEYLSGVPSYLVALTEYMSGVTP